MIGFRGERLIDWEENPHVIEQPVHSVPNDVACVAVCVPPVQSALMAPDFVGEVLPPAKAWPVEAEAGYCVPPMLSQPPPIDSTRGENDRPPELSLARPIERPQRTGQIDLN